MASMHAFSQCTLLDCPGAAIFNIDTPTFSNNTFSIEFLEIGNIYCPQGPGIYSGMFFQVYELLPDGSRVYNCGSFASSPENYLGSIPLGFGQGIGCGANLVIFDSQNPFQIGPAQGLPQCDGSVYELEVVLYIDSTGTVASSPTPASAVEALDANQKEIKLFGPYHNSVTGDFPSDAYGGPIIVNTIENWTDAMLGKSSGGEWTLNCDENIELFLQGTSTLTQCDPYNFNNGLPSEMSNSLSYSINGQPSVDILLNAGLPSSGGSVSGIDTIIGACYGGIYTEFVPTVLSTQELSPEPGDEVSIILTTSDLFTGETLSSEVIVTYMCNVTPIELISIEATDYITHNLIEWSTASEIDNDYFILERSVDGFLFTKIDQQNGAGTSSSILNYSYKDYKLDSDIVFYRLRQIDFDGSETLSDIVSVRRENSSQQDWKLYKSLSYLELHSSSLSSFPHYISIRNSSGQIEYQSILNSETKQPIRIPTGNFTPGLYIVSVGEKNERHNLKFIIDR